MVPVVNLETKLKMFLDHWSPKIVGSFNGHDIMVAKVQGQFAWHSHPDTDDFFLLLKGNLTIQLKDGDVHLGPGGSLRRPDGCRASSGGFRRSGALAHRAGWHSEFGGWGHRCIKGNHWTGPRGGGRAHAGQLHLSAG